MKGKAIAKHLPKPLKNLERTANRSHYGEFDRVGMGIAQAGEQSGVYYRLFDTSSSGVALERLDGTKIVEVFTHEQIAEIKQSPGYRYDRDHFKPETANAVLIAGGAYFSDLHPNRQNRALFRQAICDGMIVLIDQGEASKSYAGIQRGLDILFAIQGPGLDKLHGTKREDGHGYHRWMPCPKTVLGWLNKYKKGALNALALVDNYQYGPQDSPLPDAVQDILFKHSLLFASLSRPPVADVHRKMQRAIKKLNRSRKKRGLTPYGCPDYSTLEARIAANGAFYNYAGRWTLDKAKAHFACVMGGVGATRIGERWEMDFWKIHLRAWLNGSDLWMYLSPEQKDEIKIGRWQLGAVIDCASQAIVAARMAPTESAEAAIETLELGMIDKTSYARAAGARSSWRFYAGCETLATDQGPAFIAGEFKRCCASLGIKSDNPPAAMPFLRGKIERIFRTIDMQAFARLVGRTFENVTKRNPDEVKIAALTMEQLATVLVLYLVDVYHNEEHESLGGETPRHEWEHLERKYGVSEPPDMHQRRKACGMRIMRRLSAKGVRVLNNFYNDVHLNRYFRDKGDKEDVEVIVDRHNLGWVTVRLGLNGPLIIVECLNKKMHGVAIIVWIEVCRDLRRRFTDKNIPSQDIALAALDRIEQIGEAGRLANNIASPLITAEIVNLHEHMVEIPWMSREAARANPEAGGDFLARAVTPVNPDDAFKPPPEPIAPVRQPAPQDRVDIDPETGEITPAKDPDDDGDAELPDGWGVS